jgi:hypothetical protein
VTPADPDDDLPVGLGDRVACAVVALALAMPAAYVAWWFSGLFRERDALATGVACALVAAAALFAFTRPQAMPGPFLQLVAAIRWAGRR